jgi:hypothetical protein
MEPPLLFVLLVFRFLTEIGPKLFSASISKTFADVVGQFKFRLDFFVAVFPAFSASILSFSAHRFFRILVKFCSISILYFKRKEKGRKLKVAANIRLVTSKIGATTRNHGAKNCGGKKKKDGRIFVHFEHL